MKFLSWTPDQISNLIVQLTALVGGVAVVINAVRGLKNSVPNETVHKIIDSNTTANASKPTVTTQTTQSPDGSLNVSTTEGNSLPEKTTEPSVLESTGTPIIVAPNP